jgi:hypothetical protein
MVMRKNIAKKEEIEMKRIFVVFVLVLLIATVFAALPMNVGARSENARVPFNGHFDGGNVPAVDPAERIVVSGHSTQLGKYTAVVDANMAIYTILGYVEFLPGVWFPILLLPTTAIFTAENGDKLYADMDLVGMRHMGDGNFPDFTLYATITGGTGDFAGASGSFVGVGGQITMPGDDTDLVKGKFKGTLL